MYNTFLQCFPAKSNCKLKTMFTVLNEKKMKNKKGTEKRFHVTVTWYITC